MFFAERFRDNLRDQATHAAGIGDISVSGRVWVARPPAESRQNLAIGFGVKFPTGNPGLRDSVITSTGPVTRAVDQSIQPGDGGYGFSLDLQGFKVMGPVTLYGSGIYLFNPRNINGVLTGRGRQSEAIMSVADQYLARVGVVLPAPKVRTLGLTFGGRLEGIPAKDLIGKSDGFRRPGYAVSLEPGFIYGRGKETWSFSVPIAVYRNRTVSIADRRDGRHGDAAFADYVIVIGYSRRF
jgi:hypothetical protein